MNQNCNQKSCIKKFSWAAFIIVVAFIVGMVILNYLNPEVKPQPLEELQEQKPEEKLLPDEQKELQGSPELSKLNPKPQVKEEW